MGSESNRRICSTSASSDSFFSAARTAFLLFGLAVFFIALFTFFFTQGFLQDLKHREIFLSAESTFAVNYIFQIGNTQACTAKMHFRRAGSESFKRLNA